METILQTKAQPKIKLNNNVNIKRTSGAKRREPHSMARESRASTTKFISLKDMFEVYMNISFLRFKYF